MKVSVSLSVAIIAAMFSLSRPAEAQAAYSCKADGSKIIDYLKERWGEVAIGGPYRVDENRYLQNYANTEKGNWTILSHGADGSACYLREGKGYGGIPHNKDLTEPMPERFNA